MENGRISSPVSVVLVAACLLVATLQGCGAVPFEQLPKAIEVRGAVIDGDEVLCAAQVIEHATLNYYEEGIFEDEYYVGLFDSEGNELAIYTIPVAGHDIGGDGVVELEFSPFVLIVPYDTGVSAVVITGPEGEVKCAVERSANAPQIEITSPANGGNWSSVERIEWQMDDADAGDWLLVDVYWAGNSGFGWTLLEREVDGTSLEHGTALEATRLRVVVSDGFNTAEDIAESSGASGGVNDALDFVDEEIVWPTDEDDVLDPSDLDYAPKVSGREKKFELDTLVIVAVIAVIGIAALLVLRRLGIPLDWVGQLRRKGIGRKK